MSAGSVSTPRFAAGAQLGEQDRGRAIAVHSLLPHTRRRSPPRTNPDQSCNPSNKVRTRRRLRGQDDNPQAATEDRDEAHAWHRSGNARCRRPDGEGRRRSTPPLVIVGAGFGGLSAAKHLARVDRTSRWSIGTITICFSRCSIRWRRPRLSPATFAAPIRAHSARPGERQRALGEVDRIDLASRRGARPRPLIPYDYLAVATGARILFRP